MAKKRIFWAATPEAKKKLAGGYKPPKTTWGCEKMNRAQRLAERTYRELHPETELEAEKEE